MSNVVKTYCDICEKEIKNYTVDQYNMRIEKPSNIEPSPYRKIKIEICEKCFYRLFGTTRLIDKVLKKHNN